MDFPEDGPWPGRWAFAAVVIVVCWVLSMLSILSWLIIPLLGFALFRTSRRGAWLPMLLIVLANPLGVWFIDGVADYAKGAPKLRHMGLPSMEFYNIDPRTRCFRQTGGCLVSGNEWVCQDFHNLGVATFAALFGPPSRSYDGPYPSKDEASRAVSGAQKLDFPELLKGRILIGGKRVELEPEMITAFGSTLGIFALMDDGFPDEESGTFAQAAVYQDRCLILRIFEPDPVPGTTESRDQDYIVLLDLKNLRPFAYYRVKGDRSNRFPKVRYLREDSR